MGVIFYEPAVQRVLHSPLGMVGQNLRLRCEAVVRAAKRNAGVRGPTTLGIVSGDLYNSIDFEIHEDGLGLLGEVGSINPPAIHRDFSYPRYWDQNGHPWLTDALPEALL